MNAVEEVRQIRNRSVYPVTSTLVMEVADREGLPRQEVAAEFMAAWRRGELLVFMADGFEIFGLPGDDGPGVA